MIEAPLHGVVSQLHVALGDTVEKGAPVMQMEAMKLIHTLQAQVTGRIETIRCDVGDTVPAGAILIEIIAETRLRRGPDGGSMVRGIQGRNGVQP